MTPRILEHLIPGRPAPEHRVPIQQGGGKRNKPNNRQHRNICVNAGCQKSETDEKHKDGKSGMTGFFRPRRRKRFKRSPAAHSCHGGPSCDECKAGIPIPPRSPIRQEYPAALYVPSIDGFRRSRKLLLYTHGRVRGTLATTGTIIYVGATKSILLKEFFLYCCTIPSCPAVRPRM